MDERLKKLQQIGQWCREDGGLWDVITCLRGPDSPSERPNMGAEEAAAAYKARRARKYDTVEVIRGASVGQCGGARTRTDTFVTLPDESMWDHFDKHVARAAKALNVEIKIKALKQKKIADIDITCAPPPTSVIKQKKALIPGITAETGTYYPGMFTAFEGWVLRSISGHKPNKDLFHVMGQWLTDSKAPIELPEKLKGWKTGPPPMITTWLPNNHCTAQARKGNLAYFEQLYGFVFPSTPYLAKVLMNEPWLEYVKKEMDYRTGATPPNVPPPVKAGTKKSSLSVANFTSQSAWSNDGI